MPNDPSDTQPPIADYALISDCRSAALVGRDGSVDWLCFPRFDGPSVFARMLDVRAGHWSIRPLEGTGPVEITRRYLDQTLVLETTVRTPTGVVVLTDGMALGHEERGHELGADAPGVLLRRVSCTEGRVELAMTWAPRPEYGLVRPLFRQTPTGGRTFGGRRDARGLLGDPILHEEAATVEERGDRKRQRQTARLAVEVMGKLIEHYGQFGSGVPTKSHREGGYDNSFIIADPHEACFVSHQVDVMVARANRTKLTCGLLAISLHVGFAPSIGIVEKLVLGALRSLMSRPRFRDTLRPPTSKSEPATPNYPKARIARCTVFASPRCEKSA
jgi:hypothetical protein